MQDRLIVFVDGSNLLRATGTKINADIRSDKPNEDAISLCTRIINGLRSRISKEVHFYNPKTIRKYWFGSVQGNEEYAQYLSISLREKKFEPIIFRKRKGREKRVDIAIAREMLINAFNKNYDLALLVAGDEDYVDLVYDLKRLGIRVIGSFYDVGLSIHLKLAVDYFHQLEISGMGIKQFIDALGGVMPKTLPDKFSSDDSQSRATMQDISAKQI